MKLKEYKVEPENAESDFESLMRDEGRRFSVVSDDGGCSRAPDDGWKYWTGAKPKYWTDDFFAVWAALENYNYRKEATGGEDVYYFSGYNVFEPFNETAEVRSIASRLALYVQDYLTAIEEEGGAE